MNQLINIQTMSSREIAALTAKNHQHVLRDCDVLNQNYEKMGMSKIGQTPYIEPQNGQTYREMLLTKLQTLDLLTGYNLELRIRVIRRWEELETQIQTLSFETCEIKSNDAALVDILADICLIRDHELRIQLSQKVMNLRDSNPLLLPANEVKTEYSEACRMIVLQAVDTYHQHYMRTFMKHKGLAIAAAILEMAYDYIKAHKIPIRNRKHTTFYDDMANAIKLHEIKHMPVTAKPLKDKLRAYDNGASIVELIRLRNPFKSTK